MGELLATIQKRMDHKSPVSSRRCISLVPRALRRIHEESYTPQVVAIGPYHHDDARLQAMDEHKIRYVSDFFERDPKLCMKTAVEKLEELVEAARNCYEEPVTCDTSTFLGIMLFDGCFIIELMFKYYEKKHGIKLDAVASDPLFRARCMPASIRVDMLMLENQIPFFILETLFNLRTGTRGMFLDDSFLQLTLRFFNFSGYFKMAQGSPRPRDSGEPPKHFLDLFRDCCLPDKFPQATNWEGHNKYVPSVTQLYEAGVQFMKGGGNWFSGLKFSSNGVMEIPELAVREITEFQFRNLIAFEQCFEKSTEQHITNYFILMDSLIDSPHDVALLRRYKIVDNFLGDDEQVSLIFNKICRGVYVDCFNFGDFTKEVNRYYKTPWHSVRAMLGREYFYSPWATASSTAVIIVLICTIIQTVFTVISVER